MLHVCSMSQYDITLKCSSCTTHEALTALLEYDQSQNFQKDIIAIELWNLITFYPLQSE